MEVSVLLGEQDFPEGEAWAAAVLLDVSRDGREELGWVFRDNEVKAQNGNQLGKDHRPGRVVCMGARS